MSGPVVLAVLGFGFLAVLFAGHGVAGSPRGSRIDASRIDDLRSRAIAAQEASAEAARRARELTDQWLAERSKAG